MAIEMADLVARDSVVAIAADNSVYDYFLVKVTSNGVQILNDQTNGDYGSSFNKGSRVLYGNFFVRESLIDMTFKLDDTKTAIVFAATVWYVCADLLPKRGTQVYKVPLNLHEEILASL